MEFFSGIGRYQAWRDLSVSVLLILVAAAVGVLLYRIIFFILDRISHRTATGWDDIALRQARRPVSLLLPLLALNLVVPLLKLSPMGLNLLTHATSLLLILAVGYAFVSAVYFLRDLLLARYDLTATNNLLARKMHTQIGVMVKVSLSVIAVLTIAFMFMTFPGVKQVGVSLLASAGIAGLVIGLAAQKSIGTLLAGIQIAITQPIRMDDVVIVEGEWGRVEEITLTYVVVRIWDLRRLVLPITYFIEKPFQNWTRSSADVLGTVFLHTDYTIPIDEVRKEFERLLKGHKLWDGKVCVTQVTDSTPKSLEIRLLLSTANSGEGWDLRCYIREQMVHFLQTNYPGSLPKTRVELAGPSGPPTSLPLPQPST